MLKKDLNNSMIARIINSEPLMALLWDVLKKNYKQIKDLYDYLVLDSEHLPYLSYSRFINFCYASNVFSKDGLNPVTVDRMFG